MATTQGRGRADVSRAGRDGRWRWTDEQFHHLTETGVFGDRRVELIDGDLFEMTTNPPHETAVGLTVGALVAAFGPGVVVRDQKTLDLGPRDQPQPDVAVVAGSLRDYAGAHPRTALLLVEISDSSLGRDRGTKVRRYARAGILDYWIVNLAGRRLEVYRNPGPDPDRKGCHRYADLTVIPADGHVSPLAAPQARIAVADLLP